MALVAGDPFTEGDINALLSESKNMGSKPQRLVVVSLSNLDENARVRALQERMWVWNEQEINSLMHLYDKPYVVLNIGIVSDTHSNPIPKEVLTAFKKVDFIIHAGDFCDEETLAIFKKIKVVKGVWGNINPPNCAKFFRPSQLVRCGKLANRRLSWRRAWFESAGQGETGI